MMRLASVLLFQLSEVHAAAPHGQSRRKHARGSLRNWGLSASGLAGYQLTNLALRRTNRY